jgi:YfiH family protein
MTTTTSTCRRSCGTDHAGSSEHRVAILDTVSLRIRRVTTTRVGGVSVPPFDTFNLGDHVGDDPAAVAANRKRLAAATGLGDDGLVWMNQVHGDNVVVVDGPIPTLAETDGLVTSKPGLALAVVTADCVPVLMADARAGVIAAVHAGRVGAQKGIVAKTVETMVAQGAHVEHISVLLGPAVSGRNYEVPDAMAAEVEAALPGSRTTSARGTAGLDLRAGIARQLRDLGVTAVDADPRCTVDDPNLFSHRRGAPTGRLAALVWMA